MSTNPLAPLRDIAQVIRQFLHIRPELRKAEEGVPTNLDLKTHYHQLLNQAEALRRPALLAGVGAGLAYESLNKPLVECLTICFDLDRLAQQYAVFGAGPGNLARSGVCPSRSEVELIPPLQELDLFIEAAEAKNVAAVPPANEDASAGLKLIPGGIAYRGKTLNLTGRPLQLLAGLLNSKHRRLTVNEARKQMQLNDETINHPEQVVRDAAADLKKALNAVVKQAGERRGKPLESTGRGLDLTYILTLS